MTTPNPTWSAPVRYAEADQQGIVFNSHYLLYADEAMDSFCRGRGLEDFVQVVRLKASTLTWTAGATYGDVVEVHASCTKVGRTSLTMTFDIRAGGRPCCVVETVYVVTDPAGTPRPVEDAERQRLLGESGE